MSRLLIKENKWSLQFMHWLSVHVEMLYMYIYVKLLKKNWRRDRAREITSSITHDTRQKLKSCNNRATIIRYIPYIFSMRDGGWTLVDRSCEGGYDRVWNFSKNVKININSKMICLEYLTCFKEPSLFHGKVLVLNIYGEVHEKNISFNILDGIFFIFLCAWTIFVQPKWKPKKKMEQDFSRHVNCWKNWNLLDEFKRYPKNVTSWKLSVT